MLGHTFHFLSEICGKNSIIWIYGTQCHGNRPCYYVHTNRHVCNGLNSIKTWLKRAGREGVIWYDESYFCFYINDVRHIEGRLKLFIRTSVQGVVQAQGGSVMFRGFFTYSELGPLVDVNKKWHCISTATFKFWMYYLSLTIFVRIYLWTNPCSRMITALCTEPQFLLTGLSSILWSYFIFLGQQIL